jgi:hypothetical protein
MNKRLKSSLPVIAAISAMIALICIVVSILGRNTLLADTGETRQTAESILSRVQAMHPTSADDAAFRQALTTAGGEPYIAYVWLFTPEGKVLQGNLAVSPGSTVETMATEETRRVLAALPADTFSAEQRLALLAASAMQAEGEHNDVFRHLLRETRGPDGGLVALVGLTYDMSSSISAPGLVYNLSLVVGLLAMVVYWLSLPVWVWLDARERGERAWVWAVFVLLGNLVALIAYILARVPRQQSVSVH